MLLRSTRNPRSVFRAAMACLIVALILPMLARLAPPTTAFWSGVLDGVRGAALGATIALLAVSQIMRRRQSAARSRME